MNWPISTLTIVCALWGSLHGEPGRNRGRPPQQSHFSFPKQNVGPKPALATAFEPFKDKLNIAWDTDYLYIECDSMPDHRMMVGITAWNQQVPLPQPYKGSNAWRLPLNPKIAAKPVSGKETLFRGAIAVAVNGVPIFNPIKQDGRTDTNLAGELDEFGGHAGRGDDYHYHVTPWHLSKMAGKGKPVAVALDGFPIYAAEEPDGKKVAKLDWLNGHQYPTGVIEGRVHSHEHGKYHYHGTKSYPYLNGGFKGEVEIEGGQVKIQPKDQPVRPHTRPLRGASITEFQSRNSSYSLTYKYQGRTFTINYTIDGNGIFRFEFVDPDGRKKVETHRRRTRPERGR